MLLQGNESLCFPAWPGVLAVPGLCSGRCGPAGLSCGPCVGPGALAAREGALPASHSFSIRCLLRFNQGTRETVVTANILLFIKDWKLKERRGGCFWSSNMVQKWGMSLRISDRQATVEIRVDLFWMCRTVPCLLSNR